MSSELDVWSSDPLESRPISETSKSLTRIVVFGTRQDGVFHLADSFEQFLQEKKIPHPIIDVDRDVAHIQDAFFGIYPTPEPIEPTLALLEEKTHFLQRLSRLKPNKTVQQHTELKKTVPEKQQGSLPNGVIVLPNMRHYSENGNGMTVETPKDYIRQLCERFGVPVLFIENTATNEEITQGIINLLPSETT